MKTNTLSKIVGLSGLGQINESLRKTILDNKASFLKSLHKSESFAGLGLIAEKKMSFSDVVKTYNEGISEAEIKAWIWYKRQTGVPMTGWDKYYLSSNTKKIETEL